MKPSGEKTSDNEPKSRGKVSLGYRNGLLVGIFVLVLVQTLMSPPISRKLSALVAKFSHRPLPSNRPDRAPKPWGELLCDRIVLEVPDEFLSDKTLAPSQRDWFFGGDTRNQLLEQLSSIDLTQPQLALLRDASHWKSATNGFYFSPDTRLVLGMSSCARRRIYTLLSLFPENVYQSNPFTFHVDTLEERFADSGLSGETLLLVNSLLYRRGQSLCFSDLPVFDDLPVCERRRLLKTLTRVPIILMSLHVAPNADVKALVSFWGRQGNVNHVKPLLERLAKMPGGGTIDVAHLLPPFARKRLNTFPYPSATGDWEHQDCFWTSINFFNDHPESRLPYPDPTFDAVKKDFYQIQSEGTFGDLIALVTPEGKLKHLCVYIAEDVVFTKNGGHFLQPWALMKISDVVAKYPAEPPLERVILRSKKG